MLQRPEKPEHEPRFESREKLPAAWTPEHVGARLIDAFVTLDRMPPIRGPRGPGGHWPRPVTEWADQLAQAELEESERRTRQQAANRTVITPSAIEITQMEWVFGWLQELRCVDTAMASMMTLWALRAARGQSIKRLCYEKHWAPRTLWRKRAKALVMIAERLNLRAARVF